jgi:hypothetical protein
VQTLKPKVILNNGNKLVLEVKVNQTTPLTIKWFRNGVALSEKSLGGRVKFGFSAGVYTLTIEKTCFDTDGGVFTFAIKDFKNNKIVYSNCNVIILDDQTGEQSKRVETQFLKAASPTGEVSEQIMAQLAEESAKSTLVEEPSRPPVLMQRTELLKAIENQNIEIVAIIDAHPQVTSNLFRNFNTENNYKGKNILE